MPGQYSAVTVVGPQSTRDIALPVNVPVAELLPQLLRPGLLRGDRAEDEPAGWTLTTVEGRRLSPNRTLAEARVGDGEVLHLHDATDEIIPTPVEDVRDAVEDHVDGAGRSWRAGTGRVYATAVAALVVTGSAFLGGGSTAVLLTGVLICLLSVVVTWWSAAENHALARLAIIGGALWAWRVTHLATQSIVADNTSGEALRHVYGAGAALLVAVLCLIGTPLALPYVTGLGAATLLGSAGASALLLGGRPAPVASAVLLSALFSLGVLPRVSMSTGGLFGMDRRIQAGRPATTDDLRVRLERIDAMLCGGLVALAAVAALAAGVLVLDGGVFERWLGIGAGLALLTRSRVFDQIRHVAPLRVAGTLVLALAGWLFLSAQADMKPWLPAVAVLAALAYAGMTTMPRSTVGNARARRVIGIAEIVLVSALIAATGKVMGLYDMIAGMSN
ncbi:type VII secretion integral membrane protein EccD [Actinorhabdospora filicis]|uniref:Type VII secretion integral membrane protein EccD n=1 Tax=Actinorhabdospora filicis TaxID=1785913 RepID=A0A9W6W211_9ACTN|nr:type VII secretion integral membrane protein EccD [Actinorhabdospora filicis]GLZ76492.1 type VII secretion integral membrane protein EccD [Actinorhabdospora filicis]